MKNLLPPLGLALAGLLLLSGCDYDLPATPGPTRAVEPRLTGDWLAANKEDNRTEEMNVRAFDDFTYAVAIDHDVYRAFHSDVAKLPLVSVQDLNAPARKYLFYTWRLSANGTQLTLQRISTAVIPDTTDDSAVLQRLLAENAANPKLLGEALVFTKKPPASH